MCSAAGLGVASDSRVIICFDDAQLLPMAGRVFLTLEYGSEEEGATGDMGILIVRDMLLTGFDAPIEQVMYLDRPLKDHTLLQAIARTNRPYPNKKCGIIVDYCGVLKKLSRALNFNEEEIEDALIDFDKLKETVMNYPPEKGEQITGISQTDIRAIAEAYARAESSSIVYAMGITQHITGVDNVKSLANLAMLCGRVGGAKNLVNEWRTNEATYKGLEKVLDAIRTKLSFAKGYMQYIEEKGG